MTGIFCDPRHLEIALGDANEQSGHLKTQNALECHAAESINDYFFKKRVGTFLDFLASFLFIV